MPSYASHEEALADVLHETTGAIGLLYGLLCHRLDAAGVMSAKQFHDDLVKTRPMILASLGEHKHGEDRLAMNIIDAAISILDPTTLLKPKPSPRSWKPIVIDGGRSE